MQIFASVSGTLYPPYPPDRFHGTRHWLGPLCYRCPPRDTHRIHGHLFAIQARYGVCSLHPFEIQVSSGTQPVQSRHNIPNLVLSKKTDAILDPYISLPASFSRPRARGKVPPYASRRDQITFEPQSTMKKLKKVAEFTRLRPPAPMRSLILRWRPGFIGIRPFREVYSVNPPPGGYFPDCFLHSQRT